MNKVFIGFFISLLLLSGFLYWQNSSLEEDISHQKEISQKYKEASKKSREVIDRLQKRQNKAEEALAQSREKIQEIQEESEQRKIELEKLRRENEKVNNYLNQRIPDSIIEWLRDNGGNRDRVHQGEDSK